MKEVFALSHELTITIKIMPYTMSETITIEAPDGGKHFIG